MADDETPTPPWDPMVVPPERFRFTPYNELPAGLKRRVDRALDIASNPA